MPAMTLHAAAFLVSLAGAGTVMVWRLRESARPVTLRKIVIAPLAMSTGAAMFLHPAFQLPWLWALGAVVCGATILAQPLLRSTVLRKEGDLVFLNRSKGLWIALGALFLIRIALRSYLDGFLTVPQSGGLMYLFALGMIWSWRAGMLRQFLRLRAQ
jgi:membrane protein CcdC involved in cytochrome C biogenesis